MAKLPLKPGVHIVQLKPRAYQRRLFIRILARNTIQAGNHVHGEFVGSAGVNEGADDNDNDGDSTEEGEGRRNCGVSTVDVVCNRRCNQTIFTHSLYILERTIINCTLLLHKLF